MKKLATLLFLFLSTVMFAAHVDPATALQVAQNFMNASDQAVEQQTGIHRAPRKMSLQPQSVTEHGNLYVYQNANGQGFVIISAEDIAHPILGYSDTGLFDESNLPSNFKNWLRSYDLEINLGLVDGVEQSSVVAQEWDNLMSSPNLVAATPVVSPLVSTQWDQAPWYNKKCPQNYLASSTDYRTVTGCVATAMAQVMKYWNWPNQGKGSHSYYSLFYGTQSANFGATTYDWANMPSKLSSYSTSQQINAVATLMYHCGVSVEMDYGISEKIVIQHSGSSANTSETATALRTYFRYSQNTEYVEKKDYTTQTWKITLKNQLDQARPMIYRGRGSVGGHCFVCDGYDSQDYFHFNWGWSGGCDGYYPLTALDPGPNGIGSGSIGDFSDEQAAVINIYPDNLSSQQYDIRLNSSITLSGNDLQYPAILDINSSVKNFSSNAFYGKLYIGLLDSNKEVFAIAQVNYTTPLAPNQSLPISSSIFRMQQLVPGRYYVKLFYGVEDGEYIDIANGNYTNLKAFTVHNYSSSIETNSEFTILGDNFVRNKATSVEVDVKNVGASSYTGSIDLYLQSKYNLSIQHNLGSISFGANALSAGATRTLTYNIPATNIVPGTYLLYLTYSVGGGLEFAGGRNFSNPVYVIVEENMADIGYSLVVNNTDTIHLNQNVYASNEHFVSGLSLKNNDNLTFFDNANKVGWAVSTLDPYSTAGSASSSGITINRNGCFDVYLKLAYGNDQVYIGDAVDCAGDLELESGTYLIYSARKREQIPWMMSSDLGTANTKRFQADSLMNKYADWNTNPDQDFIWYVEKIGDNTYRIKQKGKYVSWNSGNSTALSTTAKDLTIVYDKDLSGYTVSFDAGDGSTRYLSLNTTIGNNFFAFYANKSQNCNLYFYPISSGNEDFVLSEGKYAIVASRTSGTDQDWYYMTSNLGTASTKRYQAVTSGTSDINSVNLENLSDEYVWDLVADGSNWKLKNGSRFSTWTTGNSANFDASGKSLTFDATENQVQVHFNDGTNERYLSLNNTAGNNYFAYYSGTGQQSVLYLLPISTQDDPIIRTDCKTLPYTESFGTSQGDFSIENVALDGLSKVWQFASGYGMKASAYVSSTNHPTESWLISPCLDLPEGASINLTFDHVYRYTSAPTTDLNLLVSEDYVSGAPSTATWAPVVIPTYSSGTNWTFVNAGNINLNAYAGKNVTLAFRYKSTSSAAATWEIKNVSVTSSTLTTGVDDVLNQNNATKCIINGHLFILRGDHLYDATGRRVEE